MRLINENGEMIGVVSIQEALEKAANAGLDLIEVSPTADPPVCKILDYGKYKYQEQKRQAEARKKQKVIEIKELKIRPTIEENDYQIKLRAAHRFLEEGNKVKFVMRFRGREVAHHEIGFALMKRIIEDLENQGSVEHHPKMDGRQILMVLGPSTKK